MTDDLRGDAVGRIGCQLGGAIIEFEKVEISIARAAVPCTMLETIGQR